MINQLGMRNFASFGMACTVALSVLCGSTSWSQEKTETMSKITKRFVEVNGITLRIAEQGEGPLVLLLHGWPESWYSWRHQIPELAKAGYHAVAPDMRGYGQSSKPESADDYDTRDITGDIIALMDALGEETAVVVGHDWGSLVAWNLVLFHPDRFRGLVAMSVPYTGRAKEPPVTTWKRQFGENFFYILYFQEPGVAEAEFDADPRGILSRLYASPDTPREAPTVLDPKRSAGGWIGRLGMPTELPPWLSQDDLNYYVKEFTSAGFQGGINYYRNFDRNWELTEDLAGVKVAPPTLFIAGSKDIVIGGATKEQLTGAMGRAVPDLRDVVLIPDIGHWVQQEAPRETNKAMIEFIDGLDK